MEKSNKTVILVIILLLTLPVFAGCAKSQQPAGQQSDRQAATPAVTSPPTPLQPVITTPAAPQMQSRTAQGNDGGHPTCSSQGGERAIAGQTCPGTWLSASDTFSCCSKKPIAIAPVNATETIVMFDFNVIMNDDLGSII